jgi:hypothetical protein
MTRRSSRGSRCTRCCGRWGYRASTSRLARKNGPRCTGRSWLRSRARSGAQGPFIIFFEDEADEDQIVVHVALEVGHEPASLPEPVTYRVLPEIEAAIAVRNGPAAGIFPDVVNDLVRWVTAHGYQPSGMNRDIWVHEVDDISQVSEQVFEIQMPFTRSAQTAA